MGQEDIDEIDEKPHSEKEEEDIDIEEEEERPGIFSNVVNTIKVWSEWSTFQHNRKVRKNLRRFKIYMKNGVTKVFQVGWYLSTVFLVLGVPVIRSYSYNLLMAQSIAAMESPNKMIEAPKPTDSFNWSVEDEDTD